MRAGVHFQHIHREVAKLKLPKKSEVLCAWERECALPEKRQSNCTRALRKGGGEVAVPGPDLKMPGSTLCTAAGAGQVFKEAGKKSRSFDDHT